MMLCVQVNLPDLLILFASQQDKDIAWTLLFLSTFTLTISPFSLSRQSVADLALERTRTEKLFL